MSTPETSPSGRENLDRIAEYIRQLHFKKALVGGIEQEDAFRAMRDLVAIFSDINKEQQAKYAALERELANARRSLSSTNTLGVSQQSETARQVEDLRSANEVQRSRIEELLTALENEREGARDAALRSAQALDEAGQERDNLVQQLAEAAAKQQSTESELDNQQKENARLEKEIARIKQLLNQSDYERESLEEIYLDAKRRRDELLNKADLDAQSILNKANEAAEQLRSAAASEAAEVKSKAEAAWGEMQQRIQDESQALQLRIQKENAAHQARITAEEAELEAKRQQVMEQVKQSQEKLEAERLHSQQQAKAEAEELLAAAQRDAEAIRNDAAAALDAAKQQAEAAMQSAHEAADAEKAAASREIEAQRGEYDKLAERLAVERQQFQAQQEKAKAAVEAQCAEVLKGAQRQADELLAEAQQERSRARADAEALIATAGDTYKKERSKYDALVRKLCDLRMEALQDIQRDISLYQSLAFELSTRGITSDSRNMDGSVELDSATTNSL